MFPEDRHGGSNHLSQRAFQGSRRYKYPAMIDDDFLDKNRSFCIFPWVHQMVNPRGNVRLCCVADYPDVELMNIHDLRESWNSPGMQSVRKDMIEGKPLSVCQHCYAQERNSNKSFRRWATFDWMHQVDVKEIFEKAERGDYTVDYDPIFVDIRFGNLCNLICKMCGPASSSQFVKDQERLQKLDPENAQKYDNYSGTPLAEIDWQDDPEVWALLETYIPHIRRFYFNGGEPMLIEGIPVFLQKIIDAGYAQDIEIYFNSNMTSVNQHFIDLCQQFKLTKMMCSIDGHGPVFEYIRYPANWKKVKENLRLCMANSSERFATTINFTVQPYNILTLTQHMDELLDLASEYPNNSGFHLTLSYTVDPRHVSLLGLHPLLRAIALERLNRWIDQNQHRMHMQRKVETIVSILEKPPEFNLKPKTLLDYSRFVDQNKKLSLQQACPELHHRLTRLAEAGM